MLNFDEFYAKISQALSIGSVKATPRGSMALATVYTCVKVISETVGMLPVHHYRKNENGREQLNEDISYTVSTRPSPFTTASDFYTAWLANTLIYGNGYARIFESQVGTTLQVIPSYLVAPKFNNGQVSYDIRVPIGDDKFRREKVPAMGMLHLKGLGFDGLEGKSPVEYAADSYNFALSTQKYGNKFFQEGAHIKGFVEMPAGVKPEGRTAEEKQTTLERIRKSILRGIKGEDSAGSIGVLPNGMKFNAVSLANDQAQFLESRKFSREEIAAMFRVPPYMVGEMGNAIKSNIEQQSIEFIQYAVMPWLVKAEQEMKYKLLTGRKDEYFKFNVNGYLRGTALERAQYLKEMRYAGLITREEGRAYEDFPRNVEGEFMMPKNTWGQEEYELALEKMRLEMGQNNE